MSKHDDHTYQFTRDDIEAMPIGKLVAYLGRGKGQLQYIRDEFNRRLLVTDEKISTQNVATWMKEIELLNGRSKHDDDDDATPIKRKRMRAEPDPDLKWDSDSDLRDEPEFQRAVEFLRSLLEEFWDESRQRKRLGAIKDFLDGILNRGDEYDELTEGQQNLLGVVRRAHADWVYENSKKDKKRKR